MEICIEPTNICSAKCTFCWYGKDGGDLRPKGFISKPTFGQIRRVLKNSNLRQRVISLSTPSGDVTCYPHLLDLIAMINDVGYRVRFYSNGILLDRFMPELFKLKIASINISTMIGSTPKEYSSTFGVDSYDRVMQNIETLKASKIPISIKDVQKRTRWDDFNGLITEADLPPGHTMPSLNEHRRIPCYGLYGKALIEYTGDISVCNCRQSSDLVISNIMDKRTVQAAIRSSESLKAIRNSWWLWGEMLDICKTCSHYHPMTRQIPRILRRTIEGLVVSVRRQER